jgi:hypothetical protein
MDGGAVEPGDVPLDVVAKSYAALATSLELTTILVPR